VKFIKRSIELEVDEVKSSSADAMTLPLAFLNGVDPWIFACSFITVAVTIWMGFRSAKTSRTASDFFVAGRSVGRPGTHPLFPASICPPRRSWHRGHGDGERLRRVVVSSLIMRAVISPAAVHRRTVRRFGAYTIPICRGPVCSRSSGNRSSCFVLSSLSSTRSPQMKARA